MLQNVLCGEKGVVHWWDLRVGELLTHISVILNFYIKIRKLTWAISPKCIHHTVWSRANSPQKKATIHQTTANSYQQWEQHNAMGLQIFDAFDVIMETIRWHWSTTVKVWQGDQNRYFNWWVQPQKRMKKHIFSENKCQTLVNKNQEVNSTRILVNGFQIV